MSIKDTNQAPQRNQLGKYQSFSNALETYQNAVKAIGGESELTDSTRSQVQEKFGNYSLATFESEQFSPTGVNLDDVIGSGRTQYNPETLWAAAASWYWFRNKKAVNDILDGTTTPFQVQETVKWLSQYGSYEKWLLARWGNPEEYMQVDKIVGLVAGTIKPHDAYNLDDTIVSKGTKLASDASNKRMVRAVVNLLPLFAGTNKNPFQLIKDLRKKSQNLSSWGKHGVDNAWETPEGLVALRDFLRADYGFSATDLFNAGLISQELAEREDWYRSGDGSVYYERNYGPNKYGTDQSYDDVTSAFLRLRRDVIENGYPLRKQGGSLGLNFNSLMPVNKELSALSTSKGTVATLSEQTGIIPANVTRNLWQLGTIAPNLVREQYPSTLAISNAEYVKDNSVNFADFSQVIEVDNPFDMEEFLRQARQYVQITKNQRHF